MSPGDPKPDPRIEPVNFVDGKAPPMLLLQGEKDTTVDKINSIELANKICKAGGKVRLILYPSRAHEGVAMALAGPFRWLAPVLKDCTDFFREN